jgi:exo-beta-1,3-glucanase (GH17 family)
LLQQNHPSIKSVVVGNEFILRVRQAQGNTAAAEARLIGYINAVQAVAPPSVAVTTAEDYGGWIGASNALFQAVDVVTWQVHPWWEQVAIQNAAGHVTNSYTSVKNRMAANFSGKALILGEVGWPTAINNGAAVGSDANQARFLRELHAWARPLNIQYWFFTNVDEKWKGAEGPVGERWGMWYSNRTPKPIITGLDTHVPPSTYWENTGPTPLRPVLRFRGEERVVAPQLFDVNGRYLGSVFGIRGSKSARFGVSKAVELGR